jgi:glutaminyl-peptide cyclotransferase
MSVMRGDLPGLGRILGLASLFLVGVSGCGATSQTLEYEVVRTLPHDPGAFTQGLVFRDGVFYESTGRWGESSIRRVDQASGEVLAIRCLPDDRFGEGLALVGDELFQLTWQAGMVLVYDAETLEELRTLEYTGEGWGLCYDGASLYMSDGSDKIRRRDPGTFQVLDEIQVLRDGFSVFQVNELECVGDEIYANVYHSSEILRIDKTSGTVTGVLDAFNLSAATRRGPDPEAVLNGIAHDPSTGRLFLTGKLWPSLYEVEIRGG